MAYRDTRRYPYTAPVQSHGSGRGKTSNKQDKSKGHISDVKGTKSARPAGMEGTVQGGPKGMAKKPKGTPIAAPGGRASRAKGYAL